jgi:hypothetical protein
MYACLVCCVNSNYRGDLHLLGKIKVKIFIRIQALIFTICHIHIMCIPRIHVCICIIQDRSRKTPVVELEDPEGGIPQEVPTLEVLGDEEQDVDVPITSLAHSIKASPRAFHSL